MNASTSLRLFSAAAAFAMTTSLFSAVTSLANVPNAAGGTTHLMALSNPSAPIAHQVVAMVVEE